MKFGQEVNGALGPGTVGPRAGQGEQVVFILPGLVLCTVHSNYFPEFNPRHTSEKSLWVTAGLKMRAPRSREVKQHS